ncbi:hypothetical protein, partial [Arenibaculum pallidiluteum]|uniref:hypothetical protein n=1 Tax=Arenibaculum pallidiluteum TaxID=2812559 RepID=UPI001A95B761
SILKTIAAPVGGALGGALGNRQMGQQIGNIAGQVAGFLPFSAGPQTTQGWQGNEHGRPQETMYPWYGQSQAPVYH